MFRVTKVEIAAEADSPRACLRFNEKIATGADISYGDFVHATPELAGIVTARGDTLCLDGLKHGETYEVELLAGFPAATGEKTLESWKGRIVVPDRKPAISFAGTGYVLPREGSAGLPVTTINLDKVKLRLVRINERNLVPSIDADKLTMSFRSGRRRRTDQPERQPRLAGRDGDCWRAQPRRSSTAIPLGDILRDKGPGVYLAVVERADVEARRGQPAGDQLGARLQSRPHHLYRQRRHGRRGALARRREAVGRGRRCTSTRATTASWHRSRAMPTGIAHIPGGLVARQRRRRAVCRHGLWPRAATSTFSKSAAPPSTCRTAGSAAGRSRGRSTPISIPIAASTARAKASI